MTHRGPFPPLTFCDSAISRHKKGAAGRSIRIFLSQALFHAGIAVLVMESEVDADLLSCPSAGATIPKLSYRHNITAGPHL